MPPLQYKIVPPEGAPLHGREAEFVEGFQRTFGVGGG